LSIGGGGGGGGRGLRLRARTFDLTGVGEASRCFSTNVSVRAFLAASDVATSASISALDLRGASGRRCGSGCGGCGCSRPSANADEANCCAPKVSAMARPHSAYR
jgi:hypothetical protein